MKIKMPLKKHVFLTSEQDPVFDYYIPVFGIFFRQKLRDLVKLMGSRKCEKLLEVGYGSGVFLVELARHCSVLEGIDIHEHQELARKMLELEDVRANLYQGDVKSIPFESDRYDAIVCSSVLEHLEDIDEPLSEMKRILKTGGHIYFGIPCKNYPVAFIFKLMTRSGCGGAQNIRASNGQIDNIHFWDQEYILKHIQKYFFVEKQIRFPALIPSALGLYVSYRCRK